MSLGDVVLIVVIGFVPVVLALLALWDIPRWPDTSWDRIGRNRTWWILLSLFGVLIGPMWYLVSVRPALEQSRSVHGS